MQYSSDEEYRARTTGFFVTTASAPANSQLPSNTNELMQMHTADNNGTGRDVHVPATQTGSDDGTRPGVPPAQSPNDNGTGPDVADIAMQYASDEKYRARTTGLFVTTASAPANSQLPSNIHELMQMHTADNNGTGRDVRLTANDEDWLEHLHEDDSDDDNEV